MTKHNQYNNYKGDIFTKEFLEKESKYKSNKQIAKENNCAISTVRKYLKKYNLRCYNPTNKGRIVEIKIKKKIRNNRWFVYDEIERKWKRQAHKVFEDYTNYKINTSKEVIHHLDFNPLNDDIHNIVLMNKKEHDKLHLILRNKHIKGCSLAECIDYLYKEKSSIKLKKYAELTRMIKCKN